MTDITEMEFNTSTSSIFVMNMCLVILAVGMAVFVFFATGAKNGLIHYSSILWLLIAFVRFRSYSQYLILIIKGKPVLIVNENYIYDGVKEITYYWKDIDEIYDENAWLYNKLYNQSAARCKINVDMINVNQDVLLNILNEFSIQESAI